MRVTKHSKQREKILEVLKNTKTHPTANEVYEMVREEMPHISLGTVYRNLAFLSEEGSILKLDVGSGTEHFDGDVSDHYHVVCTCCRRLTDIFTHDEALNEMAQKHFSGEIKKHSLVFYGTCGDCLN